MERATGIKGLQEINLQRTIFKALHFIDMVSSSVEVLYITTS